jgi:hypothetical protein
MKRAASRLESEPDWLRGNHFSTQWVNAHEPGWQNTGGSWFMKLAGQPQAQSSDVLDSRRSTYFWVCHALPGQGFAQQ